MSLKIYLMTGVIALIVSGIFIFIDRTPAGCGIQPDQHVSAFIKHEENDQQQ